MKATPIALVILVTDVRPDSLSLWMQTRAESGRLDGKLEFPGGKIEADESPREAASRELLEETGIKIPSEKLVSFKDYPYQYEDREVVLFTHMAHVSRNYQNLNASGWIDIDLQEGWESLRDRLPAANHQIMADICSYIVELQKNDSWRQLWSQL